MADDPITRFEKLRNKAADLGYSLTISLKANYPYKLHCRGALIASFPGLKAVRHALIALDPTKMEK